MPIVLYYLKCLCRVEARTQVASAFRRTLMDVHQLELFLAVMDSPSMTKAAEKSHLSPGAVSLQLHNLAEELHAELFVRRGKRLIPTPAALRLAERAKELVKLMGHIQQEFENDLSKDVRPFHFATGVTTLIYQLGRPLRQLRKRYPNAEIRVTVGVTEEMIAGLLDRRFDLALISLPVAENNLNLIPLFDEELLIVRPSTKRVGSGHVSSLRPSELNNAPFLLYPRRSNIRQIIDRFFKEIGVTPHVVMEADDTEAIKRLVESGFGPSRTRPAGPFALLSKVSSRRASFDEKPGTRNGSHRLSA